MLVGGAESTICPTAVAGFAAAKALSRRNDEPQRASRPFDKDRDGFVIGEGAGVLILEELEHAKSRGARIYAEVIGYAMNSDAFHITAPPDDGAGAVTCMERAIQDAGVAKESVGYINAHATSTFADRIETQVIKQVFGDRAYSIPVGSTKSMTGHLLGAAGGIEAVFSIWPCTMASSLRPSIWRRQTPNVTWIIFRLMPDPVLSMLPFPMHLDLVVSMPVWYSGVGKANRRHCPFPIRWFREICLFRTSVSVAPTPPRKDMIYCNVLVKG